MAHRFASWKRFTRKASVASCRAMMAWLCHLLGPSSVVTVCAISRTYLCQHGNPRNRVVRCRAYESLEWELQEEQVGRLLIAPDLAESDGAGLVALLCAVGGGSWLADWSRSVIARARCCCDQDVRLLPESLRLPVLALPPRDGRALLRLADVGLFGGITIAGSRNIAEGVGIEAIGARFRASWGQHKCGASNPRKVANSSRRVNNQQRLRFGGATWSRISMR
jgi:hypothetical protein